MIPEVLLGAGIGKRVLKAGFYGVTTPHGQFVYHKGSGTLEMIVGQEDPETKECSIGWGTGEQVSPEARRRLAQAIYSKAKAGDDIVDRMQMMLRSGQEMTSGDEWSTEANLAKMRRLFSGHTARMDEVLEIRDDFRIDELDQVLLAGLLDKETRWFIGDDAIQTWILSGETFEIEACLGSTAPSASPRDDVLASLFPGHRVKSQYPALGAIMEALPDITAKLPELWYPRTLSAEASVMLYNHDRGFIDRGIFDAQPLEGLRYVAKAMRILSIHEPVLDLEVYVCEGDKNRVDFTRLSAEIWFPLDATHAWCVCCGQPDLITCLEQCLIPPSTEKEREIV